MTSQDEVAAFLMRPETYGTGGGPVERNDTHASVVFLAGERAYKMRRAVRYPYLDYSTLDRRRRCSEAEVTINRRTAPDLYEGVVLVTREPDGRLALAGKGEAVEWLVVMRRFDSDGLFDRLAERGRLDRRLMEDLARSIQAFHDGAERRPDHGGAAAMRGVAEGNIACLEGFDVFDAEAVASFAATCRAALDRHAGLLDARRAAGRVRRCHGDLHLRNIVLIDGRPVLFDAIEFSEDFACIDVLYDLAFLLMDLDHRGLRPLASVVFNRYLDLAEDETEGLALMPLFLSQRAAIRAHTGASAAAHQPAPAMAQAVEAEARRYLDLALTYLVPPPPRLVAVGGLSGSGKSRMGRTLAPLLGPAPGALVLRSDVLRKRLLGADPLTRLSAEGYSEAVTERVYHELFARAERALAAGHTVIADAVFARPDQRAGVAAVAERAGVPFQGLWLEARPEVMAQRIGGRKGDASDATVEVLRRQLDYEIGQIGWARIDTSGAKEASEAAARRALGLPET